MLSTLIVATLLTQAPTVTSHARQADTTPAVTAHDRQLELIARIKAEREAKGGNPASTTKPAAGVKSPTDLNFRDRLKAKKARYRAFQTQQDAVEAAQIQAAKAEALRLLPYQLEFQRQQTAAATARYQADQRLAGDKAIANGLKGVTAPPY